MIYSIEELVTTSDKTREGFISFAFEKGRRASPIISEAKTLRIRASIVHNARELINIPNIRAGLLTAAGLSDKSLKYFSEEDKNIAISELIEKFLEPTGSDFLDELVFRYLLVKGDTLGGSMRNLIGHFSQTRVIRTLLSVFAVQGIDYQWADNSFSWFDKSDDSIRIEENAIAISWNLMNRHRILLFNANLPKVKKNVDLILFDASSSEFNKKQLLVKESSRILMCGELKGGIDPAGADEHWKTANTALHRIKNSFQEQSIALSFIGAAIEYSMAEEIVRLLNDGFLDFAVNLTNEEQLVDYSTWMLEL